MRWHVDPTTDHGKRSTPTYNRHSPPPFFIETAVGGTGDPIEHMKPENRVWAYIHSARFFFKKEKYASFFSIMLHLFYVRQAMPVVLIKLKKKIFF